MKHNHMEVLITGNYGGLSVKKMIQRLFQYEGDCKV